MAIRAYYGKPGSGKSYSVVANVIKPALEKGLHVVTNIPLTDKALLLGGKVTQFDNDVTVEYFASLDKGVVLIIDEAWRFCPAGERTASMPEPWREFLAMHRHHVNESGQSTEIYFVSQNPSQLNSFVKGLIDTSYVITKKSGMGVTKFRTEVYSGETATAAKGRHDNSFFSSYDPKVYELYKSSTMSDSGSVGNEESLDKRGGIGSNWMIRYGFPLALGLMCLGVYKAYSYFQSFGVDADLQNDDAPLPVVQPKIAKLAGPSLVPGVPVVSDDMKVTGYADYRNGWVVVHVLHSNGYEFDWDGSLCAKYMRSYKCIIDGQVVSPITGKNVVEPSQTVAGLDSPVSVIKSPFEQ